MLGIICIIAVIAIVVMIITQRKHEGRRGRYLRNKNLRSNTEEEETE